MKPTPTKKYGSPAVLLLAAGIVFGIARADETPKVDPLVELMFPSTPGMPYFAFPAVDISSTSPFNLGTAPRTAPSAVPISSTSPFSFPQSGGESRSGGIVSHQVSSLAAGQQPQVNDGGSSAGQTSGAQQTPPTSGNTGSAPAGTLGSGAGSQPTHHTGGGFTKPHAGGSATTPAPSASDKQPISLAEQNSLIHFGMTAGYYSHYMFRGLDVGYRTGIDSANSSAFAGASTSLTIGNFALGAWYMNSLDSYVPGGAGIDGSFGHLSKTAGGLSYKNPLDFRTPARVRYQEYDLFANYTFKLTKDLFFTPGMNFYFFNDGRFWQNTPGKPINSTVEAAASLTYTGIPHLVQNLSYFHDFEAFKGGYLEYKLATKPLTLYKGHNGFAIGLVPSVTVGYDFRYNGPNNGWNHIEPGLDIPIAISDGLTLNLGVRDSMDLGSHYSDSKGKRQDRTDDRFYFLASLNFAFPNGSSAVAMTTSGKDGKSIAPDSSIGFVEQGPWRVSVGAGVRNISAAFNVGPAAAYNIGRLYRRQKGGGDLGFASDTHDAHYLNGSVDPVSGFHYGDGTADMTFNSASQLSGVAGSGVNRQLTFSSQRYAYSETLQRNAFTSTDDDQPVYPYLSLSREVAKVGKATLSMGLGYSYSRSSHDSGTRLVGLQTASQRADNHIFTYDVDEIFSDSKLPPGDYRPANGNNGSFGDVVYDANKYTSTYAFPDDGTTPGFYVSGTVPNAGPQHNVASTSQELARVATFRSSKLELDSHTLSVPLDLSVSLTKGITARLSFGPTMNVFNADMQTDTYYQQLNPEGGVRTSGNLKRSTHTSPYITVNDQTGIPPNLSGTYSYSDSGVTQGGGGISSSNVNLAGKSGTAQAGSTNISNGNGGQSSSNVNAGGGKGSEGGQSRNLPGKTLAHYTNSFNGQHFEWGVFGQISLEFDLDRNKHWFLETYARYDYVGKFGISDGATSTVIDASSFGAGIGLGYRF